MTNWIKSLLNIDSKNPQANNKSNDAWNCFIFLNFNFFIPVPYIPFVEVIFENLEIIYLNRQFLLINIAEGLLASSKDAD